MSRTKKVSYNKLKKECKPDFFKFQDTSKLTFSDDIIGQERAVKAMEFGLKIKSQRVQYFHVWHDRNRKNKLCSKYCKENGKEIKNS